MLKWFPANNLRTFSLRIMKLHIVVGLDVYMTPIDFEVSRSKVKVTEVTYVKMVSGQ